MARKDYDWGAGATLDQHTKKKHTILKEYFRKYLLTRCQLPQQEKFKLVVVDGFAGAGLYKCGSYGSPLIFAEVLINTAEEINIYRASQSMRPIHIECLLIVNDCDPDAIDQLKVNIAPFVAKVKDASSNISIEVDYHHEKFDVVYPEVKKRVELTRCGNVLFNLDQCGYSKINLDALQNIMQTWKNAEIFLNFPIRTVTAYISPDKDKNSVPLNPKIQNEIYEYIKDGNNAISKKEWLGHVERIIFENLKSGAPYVSPFSINNPDGWGYWLMHFANSYRARQVYNDILHENSTAQAHYGRSGLDMLSYNPEHEQDLLYVFDQQSRSSAQKELYDDIPRLVATAGDVLPMEDFYKIAYNGTPAHSADIHEMIIKNPDIEVITEAGGGERRKASSIKANDLLKLKSQTSWFSMFDSRED